MNLNLYKLNNQNQAKMIAKIIEMAESKIPFESSPVPDPPAAPPAALAADSGEVAPHLALESVPETGVPSMLQYLLVASVHLAAHLTHLWLT